jgi:hypothetical protein
MTEKQSAQDYFRTLLLMVVGQAFTAGGYELDDTPLQWVGGKYRFSKPLDAPWRAYIEYQALIYTENSYTGKMPSRFRVNLIRSDQTNARPSQHPRYAQRTLSQLVVADFGVAILPHAEHWWTYSDTTSLGNALAEAGHLVVGYAMPWLDGTLEVPATEISAK